MRCARFFPKLFEPGQIGSVKTRNRIAMLPIAGYFPGPSGEISERSKSYLVRRAKGGVGLIIVGLTGVTPRERPIMMSYGSIAERTLLPSHYHLTEAVHLHGARIGIQLCHIGGQMTAEDWGGEAPLSPSGIQQIFVDQSPFSAPRAMTRDEVYRLIESFGTAGRNARLAGYDLAEVHAAHGYLLSAFLSPATNKRTDEFGGCVENRTRIVVEIINKIHRLAGDEFPVGVCISADEFIPGGITLEDAPTIARILEQAGAAYINVTVGTYASLDKMIDVMRMEEGWKQPIWAAIKRAVNIPIIAGGGIRSPQFCERLLAEGDTDFVGLGRPLLADAFWANKAKDGRDDEICPCISCIRCFFALGGGRQIVRHCTVNAMWGREVEYADRPTSAQTKNVMIVGGGVAGLEAARVASLRGHKVTLYEKAPEVGGQALLSRDIPGKSKLQQFVDYLLASVERQGVKIELGTEVDPDIAAEVKPDVLILATGARPSVPNIPGAERENVLSAWNVLQSKPNLRGKRVVVLGGGAVGAETAEFLAHQGNVVTIVEMLPQLCLDMEPINRHSLLEALNERQVQMLPGKKALSIHDTGIAIQDVDNGEKQIVQCEYVVLAVGSTPSQDLVEALEHQGVEIYSIGDCRQSATLLEAVRDGFLVAHEI